MESRAAEDGLEVAALKCGHMRVNGIRRPGQQLKTWNGELVLVVTSHLYLGSIVTNNQQSSKELWRRLLETSTRNWKPRVFNAAITSEVLYGLVTK